MMSITVKPPAKPEIKPKDWYHRLRKWTVLCQSAGLKGVFPCGMGCIRRASGREGREENGDCSGSHVDDAWMV